MPLFFWGRAMNIQLKLVGLMASMLLVLVVLMVVIGTSVINTIIYGLNTDLLSLTLDGRIEKIESTINVLEDSGATGIASYVKQAQREVLQQFEAETTEQRENFYVIAPQENRALFQSHMSQEEEDTGIFLSDEAIQTMVENGSGSSGYELEGIGYFTVYRYVEAWDWLIGASLPETTMFAQRQDYLITVGWTALLLFIVLLTVAFLVGKRLIATPVMTLSTVAKSIAAGNFDQSIHIRQRDEIGALAEAFRTMQTTIQQMLQDVQGLLQAIQDGQLTTRGDTENYSGGWRDLIGGVNNVVEAFIEPITTTATALACISQGDIPDKITADYQGDFNTTKDNVNELIETMEQISEVAERISIGDLSVELRKRSERDRLMNALGNMVEGMKDIAQSAEVMSTGNLLVELEERSDQDILMQALNSMIQHVKSAVLNVKDTSNTIVTMSRQLSASSEQLSNGSSEQAASMEESSSSMEEMAANIRQNTDNARQTEKIALQSAEYAEEAGRVVAETVMAMQQIAQKIAIIEDIANQTRLLSLNATIEAARAQDHGKAFSVVASEVRQLSDTTKKAAEEISQLASSSLGVSEKAGTMLATLVPSIQKTTELVQEISAASNEQSAGVEQINRAIQQADQVTQQNATIAEETASSAEELTNQARQLQDTIAFFTIDAPSSKQPPKHDWKETRSGKSKPTRSPSKHKADDREAESGLGNSPRDSQAQPAGDELDNGFEHY
jgi:methyl-accepting chemotaxis protein